MAIGPAINSRLLTNTAMLTAGNRVGSVRHYIPMVIAIIGS